MNFSKSLLLVAIFSLFLFTIESCKTKKLIQKPVVTADTPKAAKPVAQAKPAETPKPAAAPTENTANSADNSLNFANVQFEFNSAILKTDSYPVLDNAASVMKANPDKKFILKGYASAEGTDEHNMSLSVDRANAVKAYLVNSGINPDNVSTKGFGQSNPIADNNTEDGRVLNRRVEIKKM